MRYVRMFAAVAVPVLIGLVATTTANAGTRDEDPVNYVALGDSYSSGVGAGDYDPNSGNCLRSPNAYASLWNASHTTNSFTFAACSGAKTQDVLDNQLSSLDATTTLVTISIGGNDAGFGNVVQSCVLGGDDACNQALDQAEAYINNELPGRLDLTYSAIKGKSPSATVVVAGYPHLYETEVSCDLSNDKRVRMATIADELSDVTSGRASAAGFLYADARPTFAGHGICGDTPWINGLTFPVSDSFHPTKTGQSDGYLPAITALIG